jgi:CheY-like chemotaxis protein
MERGKRESQSSSAGSAPGASVRDSDKDTAPTSQSSLEELMFALYQTQKQMLTLLEQRLVPVRAVENAPQSDTIAGDDDFAAFPPATTRANKRKSVLLIDDDDASRAAAVAALEKAEVPVRTAVSGQAAMELLTEETPDVIALEGEMSGEVSGKDIIDRVKAVMEWVNIPILLYTQARVESQQEARLQYGADGYILKGPKGPDALVSQVIALFRA